MAKTKTPLFSLSSQGSLGNVLTSQKRSSSTLLRSKPTPTDRYTLPQAYQRWLYEDYAYLWRQQDQATQDAYRSAGVRFHLTAFQYWMKYNLTHLPDILAWWKLDTITGTTQPDSGRNSNHGTVFGASPIAGLIDGALRFDGINDRVTVPHSPSLMITEGTIEFIVDFQTYEAGGIIEKGYTTGGYLIFVSDVNNLWLFVNNVSKTNVVPPGSGKHHITALISSIACQFYIDGLPETPGLAGTPTGNTIDLEIGRDMALLRYPQVDLDNIIIYNRLLDSAEILRHSQRQYSPP